PFVSSDRRAQHDSSDRMIRPRLRQRLSQRAGPTGVLATWGQAGTPVAESGSPRVALGRSARSQPGAARSTPVASTTRTVGTEHLIVAGGGFVALDLGILDTHCAAFDINASPDALAVGDAVAPVGHVVHDGRTHDASGGVREIEAAAQPVTSD